jgi:hypothetical protein
LCGAADEHIALHQIGGLIYHVQLITGFLARFKLLLRDYPGSKWNPSGDVFTFV